MINAWHSRIARECRLLTMDDHTTAARDVPVRFDRHYRPPRAGPCYGRACFLFLALLAIPSELDNHRGVPSVAIAVPYVFVIAGA
jgi:hypothetical protein